jgi:hypothetical protein
MLPPAGFAKATATPVLDHLLARSRVLPSTPLALEPTLLHLFGLSAEAMGVAALTRLGDGGTERQHAWLRADPVHLAVTRDTAQLFDSHVINPTAEEMAALAETINQHFAADGLRVTFPDAARGYIQTELNNLPKSTPLWQMGGANVFDNLPLSKTKTNWRALSNEIQMLLHEHPVNAKRTEAGIPAINALWIWGGGSVEQALAARDSSIEPQQFGQVVARLVLARGLAMAHDIPVAPLPASLRDLTIERNTLVVLHTATREVRGQSRDTWPAEVTAIEQQWIAPALAAFDAGTISGLTLLLPSETVTLTAEVAHEGIGAKLMAGFRRKKSLADYA